MPPDETVRDMYRRMYTIRYYNEAIEAKYEAGADVPAGIHGSKGQEAPAVGVCQHLRDDDWAFTYHRSAHVAIAKGVDLEALAAEQLGRAGGVCGGKAGEQHLFAADANFVSGAIVAQHLPSATGVALAHQKRGTDAVVVGYLGDGAANQGAFYECLNLASVHDLPIVFVVEDNDWGISTPKERVTAVANNAERAAGQGMPGRRIEDNDVGSVYEAAGEAIERAREGRGPTLLAVQTDRMQGHFFADPESYRDEAEREAMRANDCMKAVERAVRDRGLADEDIQAVRSAVERRVDEAVESALDQPAPDPALATRDVFSDGADPGTGENVPTREPTTNDPTVGEGSRMAPAVAAGIRGEMERSDDVFVMGEDIGEFGGVFDSTEGLFDAFGPDRVIETPISETGFIGAGVGAAMAGFRPVVELMYVDFAGVAMDQIYNEMAKVSYMSDGSFSVPVVLMTAVGMTPYQDPTHGQSLYGTFAHFPGLKVVVPSSPSDAKGLMHSAVRDDDPVVYMFHKQLMLGMAEFADGLGDPAPAEDYEVPLGEAAVRRAGSDVTVATLGLHVHRALEAADRLAADGVDAEVLDLRSLVPLDTDRLAESVAKTNRLLVVDEDYRSFGVSGELIARLTERRPAALDAATRLAVPDTPVPYAPELKEELDPGVEDIAAAARDIVE
jgi:2-oxoisovalerate dehydrogenase E1 component